jgi:dihydropteroate synthase
VTVESPKVKYNVRVVASSRGRYIAGEIASCGVKKSRVEDAVSDTEHFTIKLESVPAPECIILKYRMLEAGGTLFFSESVLEKGAQFSDSIVTGSRRQFRVLRESLQNDPFDLPSLGRDILEVIEHFCRDSFVISYPGGSLTLAHRPFLVGVINVTPDSFSDGGDFLSPERAIEHGLALAEEGADILDIGGESTRPGAQPVEAAEELRRVIPVISALSEKCSVPLSIDTYKAEVAVEAIAAGAKMVNDITGLFGHSAMAEVVAEQKVPVVLMHIKGTPEDMQVSPKYKDLISEIIARLRQSLERAKSCGIDFEKTIIDPGIGFGKTAGHNLEILNRLDEFRSLGRPVMVGTSRKSFIGQILGVPPKERILGTAVSSAVAILKGAKLLRVHDVRETKQVLKVTNAIATGKITD